MNERIKRAQLRTALWQARTAKLRHQLLQMNYRPSLNLPVSIRRDGGHWVCSLETSDDPLECPIAYGESPFQATLNFDALWMGTGHLLEHPEVEDEGEDDDDMEEF